MLRKIPPTHPAYREEEIPFTRGWAIVATREAREVWPLLTGETGEIGTQRVQGKGSFVGWLAGLVVPVETFILPWMLWSTQYKIFFFPHRTLFQFMCPHRPAAWAGNLPGPPVSGSNKRNSFRVPTPLTCTFGGLSLILIPNLNLWNR
jgi:hypothetical protein